MRGHGAVLAVYQIKQPVAFTNSTTNSYETDGSQRHRGVELSPISSARFRSLVPLLTGADLQRNEPECWGEWTAAPPRPVRHVLALAIDQLRETRAATPDSCGALTPSASAFRTKSASERDSIFFMACPR